MRGRKSIMQPTEAQIHGTPLRAGRHAERRQEMLPEKWKNMSAQNIPDVDLDLYADESLLNPYQNYAILRDTAPIVRLPKYDVYVMSRFADVQAALKNWSLFSSASGVGLND